MNNFFIQRLLGIISFFLFLIFFFAPVSAHEVYVLNQQEISSALSAPPLDVVHIIKDHLDEFVFWGFLTILIIVIVFSFSISRTLEDWLDPFFARIKKFAPFISRTAIGLSFVASAYYNALFGPELSLPSLVGDWSQFLRILFFIIGVLFISGFYSRLAALIGIGAYAIVILKYGAYAFTYLNYLGELLVILFIGSHRMSMDHALFHSRRGGSRFFAIGDWLYESLARYSFAILRMCFGFALVYASYYAKYLHGALALETVQKYQLTRYFHFDPGFLVLGAMIIEILLGVFFILGIEIRFSAVFLSIFLFLSLVYFKEAVWPHLILFGVAWALFAYGYDEYSLEGRFFRRRRHMPIF